MLFSPLCSGSSGNSSFLEAVGCRLLIDAGVSAKRITGYLGELSVAPSAISGILVTHEHSDHISGIGVLAAKYGIRVYVVEECLRAFPKALAEKIPFSCLRVIEPDREFMLGGLRVLPFSIPHDAAHAVGYSFSDGTAKCTVLTDVGHFDDRLIDICAGSNLLLIEANHDVDMLLAGSYPYQLKQRILSKKGHLCNDDCGKALVRLYETGVRNVILGHLSGENNTPDIARVTVETVLKSAGISDMNIQVALRDRPLGIFSIT